MVRRVIFVKVVDFSVPGVRYVRAGLVIRFSSGVTPHATPKPGSGSGVSSRQDDFEICTFCYADVSQAPA